MKLNLWLVIIWVLALIISTTAGYYFGYDIGYERAIQVQN